VYVFTPAPVPAFLVGLLQVLILVFSSISRGKFRQVMWRRVLHCLVFSNDLYAITLHVDEEGNVVGQQLPFAAAEGHADRRIWVRERGHVHPDRASHLTRSEEEAVGMAERRRHAQ
jgi:hypothetical protein